MFQIINYVVGILSLIYFCMYAIGAGLSNVFTYFWLILGVVSVVFGIMNKMVIKIWTSMHIVLRVGIIGVLCIVAVLIIAVMSVIINYGTKMPKSGAEYVIVLGSQVRGRTPSYNLAKRLDKATEYLQLSKETKVIVSGGQGIGEDITEAEAMETYLIDKGIAKERIIKEDKSSNTDENIQFSRKIIKDDDCNIVIVTSAFHVYRGIRIAKKQGLNNVEGLGSNVMWYTVPNLYLRETIAVIKYYLFGQI